MQQLGGAMLPAYRRLSDYYQSEQWMADHEASNAGELPEGLLCGVLSEDAVYDLFIDQRELALYLAKTAFAAVTVCFVDLIVNPGQGFTKISLCYLCPCYIQCNLFQLFLGRYFFYCYCSHIRFFSSFVRSIFLSILNARNDCAL